MIRAAACYLVLIAVLPIGCGGVSSVLAPEGPAYGRVDRLSGEPLPAWVLAPRRYPGARPGFEYIRGVGLPRRTATLAQRSALDSAGAGMATYVGQVAALKWQRSGGADRLSGGGSAAGVAAELVWQCIADADIKKRAVESHIEQVRVDDHGREAVMFRAYRLCEVSHADLAGFGRRAAELVAEEAKAAGDLRPAEELDRLGAALKALAPKDFKW
jgi:hypothetical protein